MNAEMKVPADTVNIFKWLLEFILGEHSFQ